MPSAGPGLQGSREPRPSSQAARSRPCRCTLRPLLGPLRGNRLPAQVLSLEALNVAFQKFLKLPRPAQHSRVTVFPRSLHPRYRCSTGGGGGGKGAGRRRLSGRSTTSERQARPRALGDPLPSPTSEEAQTDCSRTAPARGGRGREGRGEAGERKRDRAGAEGMSTLPGFLCRAPAKGLFKMALRGGRW